MGSGGVRRKHIQNITKLNLFLSEKETYRGGSSGGSRVGEAADVGLGSGADHSVRDVGNLSYGAHGCCCWWCCCCLVCVVGSWAVFSEGRWGRRGEGKSLGLF